MHEPFAPHAAAASPAGSLLDTVDGILGQFPEVTVAYRKDRQARGGQFDNIEDLPLVPALAGYLRQQYPGGLYSHQAAALRSIYAGQHTVVSTPTSSGKSLIFTVPAVDALLTNQNATALFIYPQKALANDQLGKIRDMFRLISGKEPSPAMISRYDGATPQDARPAIRDQGRIIITNPDMLHLAILQYHSKWARFFRQLRYVVIDEAHDYRGVFGSSVAYVLRRLRSLAAHYGSRPVFISASATLKDASEHLEKLTHLKFHDVGSNLDGSVQGNRRIWLLKSEERHWNVGRRLTQALVEKGLSCLTFCGSRTQAERLLDDLPDSVRQDDRIRVYRAGLDSREREAVESALKKGTVKGVFCTSALELGIDIGSLDVVVCIGLPSTMMSLWQRAGRVGRAGRDGAIIFIAADTPLDSYYAEHPDDLFGRETEPLAVNLQNRRLLCHHLACAIDELGDENSLDYKILGDAAQHAMELRRSNRLNHDVFYSDDKHSLTPIRSSDSQNFTLSLNDEDIGEIDYWHMLREAYPKAIYLHGGRRYRVVDILRSKRTIRLTEERSRNRTVPVVQKDVFTRRPRRVLEYDGLTIAEADIEVKELLVAVQEKKPDGQTLKVYEGSQGLLPYRLPTEGISIELKGTPLSRLVERLSLPGLDSASRAIDRLIASLFPVIVGPCDLMDYSTFTERRDSTLIFYLYDQVHDGIDLTIQAFDHVAKLLNTVRDRIATCDCPDNEGCFRCVKNPDDDEPVSKQACLSMVDEILAVMREVPKARTFNTDRLEEIAEVVRQCPKCQAQIKGDARFCSDCGERLPVE